MNLTDEEIEIRIKKTVYKLEKFYKLYNIIYKIKTWNKKIKDIIFDNFMISIALYTFFLLVLFRSFK